MPHIFVSHATADNDIVFRIHDQLEAATGKNLWLDRRDLKPGDNWQDAIDAALRDCESLLLVLSRNSANRPEVTAEWRDALLRERDVYIAVIDDIPATDIPARLRLITWVDLQTDWDGGIAALAAAIQGEATPPGAPVTTVRPVTGKIDRRLTTIPISGRDADLIEIQRLLKRGPTAILGVGGLGKSRLAAEIVVNGDGIGGAIWHTVSDISRADEVLELLREHFNLNPTTSRTDTLAQLKPNKRLIVLDNAEDVKPDDPRRADYVALVDDLVNVGALLLFTSRVEWDDIQLCQPYTPQTLSNEAARQIVLDMAAAFTVPHDLTAQADTIATAARLHPRLIEWALRQMKKFPPDKVIRDLKDLKSRDIQTALDEMILKTLRQMTDAEGVEAEAALKCLTVCRGGFTYAAALAITGFDDDNFDEQFAILQTWQFVTFDGKRYQIDPLVIAAVGEDDSAHGLHYDFYSALAQQYDKKQDYFGLDPESANLEAAFEWAMQGSDGADALWLANSVGNFLPNRGRFTQILEWDERVVRALADHPDKMLWANAQNSLAIDYWRLPVGNRHDNLKRAITAFEAALVYRTVETAPLDYAMTQNNLGTVYMAVAKIEDQETNLKRAVAAYEVALVYRTVETAPLDYAGTQNNLGNTYGDLAEIEDREANLKRAVVAYEAALVYYSPEAAPLNYATTQNNLGTVYWNLSEIEDRETNLKRAVAAYEAALVYRMAEAAPLDYAQTQYNLGFALRDQGDLKGAVSCWREAEHYARLMQQTDYADRARRLIDRNAGEMLVKATILPDNEP